jgi:hypothetical protein
MYLHLSGEWDLPPLAGITTAPVLSADGTVRAAQGYDAASQLWCATVPLLIIPERPSREQAEAALRLLRTVFRTFPFADAPRDARIAILAWRWWISTNRRASMKAPFSSA